MSDGTILIITFLNTKSITSLHNPTYVADIVSDLCLLNLLFGLSSYHQLGLVRFDICLDANLILK